MSGVICACGWDKTELRRDSSYVCSARESHWACERCVTRRNAQRVICKRHGAVVTFTDALWGFSVAAASPWRPWVPSIALVPGTTAYAALYTRLKDSPPAIQPPEHRLDTPIPVTSGFKQTFCVGDDLIRLTLTLGAFSAPEVGVLLFVPPTPSPKIIELVFPGLALPVSWPIDPQNRSGSLRLRPPPEWRPPEIPEHAPFRYTAMLRVRPGCTRTPTFTPPGSASAGDDESPSESPSHPTGAQTIARSL